MHKIYNNSFPTCFDEFFIQTSHTMTTRSNRSFNLEKPRIQLTKQSINYKGTLVWNKIPKNLKYEKNSNPTQLTLYNTFKNNLKDFILTEGPVAISHYLNEILYTNREV